MSVSDIQISQRSFIWEDQGGHQRGSRVCVWFCLHFVLIFRFEG